MVRNCIYGQQKTFRCPVTLVPTLGFLNINYFSHLLDKYGSNIRGYVGFMLERVVWLFCCLDHSGTVACKAQNDRPNGRPSWNK